MKRIKEVISKIQEFRKKSYGNSILFFGFYLIFFIIVIALIRTSPAKKDVEYQKNNMVGITSILNKNYSFSYKVVLDNNTYLYKGDRLGDNLSFTYNEKEYFQNNSNTYIKEENWISIENPIKFKYFFNEANLEKILNNLYYESNTTYESGKIVYNFLISSNSLNSLIDNNETDYDEIPNKVAISVNNDIESISFDLDSYCKINKLCNNSLKINIDYDNYNGVKEIINPIN